MNVVVSDTGRVHVVERKTASMANWYWTKCGQHLIGWTPAPDQALAVTCRRCQAPVNGHARQ